MTTISAEAGRAGGDDLVSFALDGCRYAVPLASVERCLHALAVTPMPGAPAIVRGIVNLAGAVLPVVDLRRRFGHPTREMRLSDHLIVARTSRRRLVLLVDEATGVIESGRAPLAPTRDFLPSARSMAGVIRLDDGLVMVHDLESLLSPDEETILERALEHTEGDRGEAPAP